jgi:hypothetical protein
LRKKAEQSSFICFVDSQGRNADLHALRENFITNLSKSGVSPKMAQSLARHSDINLTMNVYTEAVLEDQRHRGGVASAAINASAISRAFESYWQRSASCQNRGNYHLQTQDFMVGPCSSRVEPRNSGMFGNLSITPSLVALT